MALTEKISSSTSECNGLNTVNNPNVTRSDTYLFMEKHRSPIKIEIESIYTISIGCERHRGMIS